MRKFNYGTSLLEYSYPIHVRVQFDPLYEAVRFSASPPAENTLPYLQLILITIVLLHTASTRRFRTIDIDILSWTLRKTKTNTVLSD